MNGHDGTVKVRTTAFLYDARRQRGLAPSLELRVPDDGLTVHALAELLELEPRTVEAAFLNNVLVDTDTLVRPGDSVALLPQGTPATHPAFLGPARSVRA